MPSSTHHQEVLALRRAIKLGRRLAIDQRWRDRKDGTVWRVQQVHRGDCHVDLVSLGGRRRTLSFEDLRTGWDQVVRADEAVAA
jgi:hypothetical protein